MSILCDHTTVGLWLQDGDTAWNIVYMLNTFYDMKQIHRTEFVLAQI